MICNTTVYKSVRILSGASSVQIGPETLTEASKMALLPLQQIRMDKGIAKAMQV